jgi:hypothetical protein
LRVVNKRPPKQVGASATGKVVNVNAPRFREQDIPIAITTLIQVLVVQFYIGPVEGASGGLI